MAGSSPGRPARPGRRRQRSVRVTVAVALLGCATVAVLASLPTGSAAWIGVAAVFALVCGWAAARIVYNELVQSRREHAADRAAQAAAYHTLFAERAAEHAAFTSAVTDKLLRTDQEVQDLSGVLLQAERRAAEAEDRVRAETRRAEQASAEVAALRRELDERATTGAVSDLLVWEERVSSIGAEADARAASKPA